MIHQTIAERLDILRRELDGFLSPRAVVRDARHLESPLHLHFEWDDRQAARCFRLHQARLLIQSVWITFETPEVVETAAYVRDPYTLFQDASYYAVEDFRKDPAISRDTLAEEFARGATTLRSIRNFAAACGLLEEFRAILDQELANAQRT